MAFQLPDPATPFGERVARRLHNDLILWLTMITLCLMQLLSVPILLIGGAILVKWQARTGNQATSQVD